MTQLSVISARPATSRTLYENGATRLRMIENIKNARHQWAQIIDAVAWSHQDDNRDIEGGKVLLMRKISIARQEHVEIHLCQG